MAGFVHLTPERRAGSVHRSGIVARGYGHAGGRGVYVMPVLDSFLLTHQWARELRRWHGGPLVAVDLRIPDAEPVLAGRYNEMPVTTTAAEAVATIGNLADPRGYEVFVPLPGM